MIIYVSQDWYHLHIEYWYVSRFVGSSIIFVEVTGWSGCGCLDGNGRPQGVANQSFPHLLLGYCWRKISGDHQLRLVDYPIIYKILYNPGGTRISSINSIILKLRRCVFAEILIDIRLPRNTIEEKNSIQKLLFCQKWSNRYKMMINVYGFFRWNPMSHLKLPHQQSSCYSSGEDPSDHPKDFRPCRWTPRCFGSATWDVKSWEIIKGLLTIGFPYIRPY